MFLVLKKESRLVITCLLLISLVIYWYGFLNPYISIFYREQSQMFLFDSDYLLSYLRLPGGLTAYIASFLIQFFHFRWIGVLIYLCLFFFLYVAIRATWKKFSIFNQSFFAAFIPGMLFLPASINMLFDPADELSLIFALLGFIALAKLSKHRFYYLFIPMSITALFIIVGGNAIISLTLLTLSLFACHARHAELVSASPKHKTCNRQPQTTNPIPPLRPLMYVATGLVSFLIPIIVWYFLYLVSFKAVCFALTPFRYPDTELFDARSLAWISIIILPLLGMLLRNKKIKKKWTIVLNTGVAIVLLFYIVIQHKPDLENNVKMGFDAENHRWESILETGALTSINPLRCYYTNLALQQTGHLADKMFYYDQIGVSGLFVEMKDHFSCYARSELFFQLGWINPAQHSVYESMSGYTFIKEPNIRNIRRLYDCAVMGQNSVLAIKYEKMLNRTLFYKTYAKNRDIQADYPATLTMRNSLIRNMPAVLETILEDNDHNKAIFEYLMAWYLLERDYEKAKQCFDRYFHNFSYRHIPTHYAEFLLLYKRINQLDDSFYEKYPITRELRERFDMMDTLVQSNFNKMIKKTLEDNFKHTYWFYVKFPLVQVQTTSKDEKYIY